MLVFRVGKRPLLVGILTVALVTGHVAHGDMVTLGSSKDNTLYQFTDAVVSNGTGQGMFSGRNPAGNRRRALIQFDIAGAIPAGATITNVAMTLNMSRTTAPTETISLHKVLASWGEGASDADFIQGGGQGAPAVPGEATWHYRFLPSTPWISPGGDFSPTASGSIPVNYLGVYTWNSTSQMVADVQNWLDNSVNNFGWILVGNESMLATTKRFDTRENSTPNNRPKLIVTFQPPVFCVCIADLNGDNTRDGRDIEGFVQCLLGAGGNCGCADVNGGGLNSADVTDFVAQILVGDPCP